MRERGRVSRLLPLMLAVPPQARQYRLAFACWTVGAVGYAALALSGAVLVDRATGATTGSLLGPSLVALAAAVGIGLAELVEVHLLTLASNWAGYFAQNAVLDRALGLSPRDIADRASFEVRVRYTFAEVHWFAGLHATGNQYSRMYPHMLALAACTAALVTLDPLLAGVFGAFSLLLHAVPCVVLTQVIKRIERPDELIRYRHRVAANAFFEQAPRVRALGLDAPLARDFMAAFEAMCLWWQTHTRRTQVLLNLVPGCALTFFAVLGASGWGRLSPGDMVAFALAGLFLVQATKRIESGSEPTSSRISRDYLAINDARTSIPEPTGHAAPPPLRGGIEVSGVTLGYGPRAVLRDLSLAIAPGEKVGIVGRSGCGKSTLLHLLMRLMDPEQGEIRIDGVDLRALRRETIGATFAYIGQELELQVIQGSIRDNIALAFGRPSAFTDEQLIAALRRAGAEFVLDLPEGLDSPLYGVVSQGQLQRILLARVYLRDPRVIALDEFTANLDVRGEHEVLRELRDFAAGRTLIVVSHRLESVCWLDRILFLEDGAIVESGTHAELMARGGRYHDLFRAQLPVDLLSTARARWLAEGQGGGDAPA